jgi:hypothetical protein
MVLMLSLVFTGTASAAPSAEPTGTWSSVIYYYNTENKAGNLTFMFYQLGTVDPITPADGSKTVAAFGSGSYFVGVVGIQGSAVVSADVQLSAVYRQFDDTNASGQVLYSSFDVNQLSTAKVFIPSVRNKGGWVSQVGVQNIEAQTVSMKASFFKSDGTSVNLTKDVTAQASWVFKMNDADVLAATGADFEGAVVIEAVNPTTARMAAAIQEVNTAVAQQSVAYEGMADTKVANTLYLPQAGCLVKSGTTLVSVQNAGTTDTDVSIEYHATSTGKVILTQALGTVKAGASVVADPCTIKKLKAKAATAIVRSTAAPVAAVGKYTNKNGFVNAVTAQPAGATKVVVPYVEWAKSTKGWRTYLNILNTGAATTATIVVRNPDGTQMGKNLNRKIKAGALNVSNPSQVSKFNKKSNPFLGVVEITSATPLVVQVSVTKPVKIGKLRLLGEDYSAIFVQ